MSVPQYVYDHSPIFVQNILVSLKGHLNERHRYGDEYYRYLGFLRDFDKRPLADKQKFQMEELRGFLRFAVENSGFYAKLYEGIDIDKIDSLEALKQLPTVDKETLRENIHQIVTHTGEPVIIGREGRRGKAWKSPSL